MSISTEVLRTQIEYSAWASQRLVEAAGLTAADADRPLIYKDLKGNEHTTPYWQVVMHVVNHGTHHRGQAAGFLRSMGHQPPVLDLIAYYRKLSK